MSVPCDFERLSRNLQLLSAPRSDRDSELVPDLDNSEIVRRGDLKGIVFAFFYKTSGSLCGIDNVLPHKLQDTLEKIRREFSSAIVKAKEACATYQTALSANSGLDKKFKKEEKAILQIGSKCKFLTEQHVLYAPRAALDVIQNYYTAKIKQPLATNEQLDILETFGKNYAMAVVAGILQMHFPIRAFMSLCETESQPSAEDFRAVQKWVARCQEKQNKLTVWMLHKALQGIIEPLYSKLKNPASSAAEIAHFLEYRLYQGGLKKLGEADPKQLEWKKTVQEGSVLSCPPGTFVVGKPLVIEELKKENIDAYEIAGDASQMLLVAANPVILSMKQVQYSLTARRLQPVDVVANDQYTRFAVVERVEKSLASYEWRSKFGTLQNEDVPLLDKLSELLEWLARLKESPITLNPQLIYVKTKEGDATLELRTLAPLEDFKTHDFLVLERFARDLAKGNAFIFSYLMNKTHLVDHPVALFYQNMAKKKLLDDADCVTLSEEAALLRPQPIRDEEVVKTATALVNDLKSVRDQLMSMLKPLLKDSSKEKELQTKIVQMLVAEQRKSGYCSTLYPKFRDQYALPGFSFKLIGENPTLLRSL